MSDGKRQTARARGEEPSGIEPLSAIRDRVLRYFHRNSGAMDSAEGIARFWVHQDRSVVERCLEGLLTEGLLDRRTIAGTDFYSLCKGTSPTTPAPTAPAGGQAAAVPAAPSAAVARGSETGCRILVIDDETSVRRFLVAALAQAGHSVLEAEDGELGLEIFRADPCDLVVTDVMMPGMSGMEVLRAIKEHSPTTEVIVLTAHASLETAVRALRHGAYDLITKPVPDLESLYRVVSRALERRRLSVDNRLLVDNLQSRNVELKQTVARLAAVNEIGKATTGLLDMEQLYDALVRLVAQQLNARRVSVLVADPDSDTMALVASVGITEQEALRSRVKVGQGIAGKVAASQAPLLVQDIEKSDLRGVKRAGKYTTASFMITPLTVSYPIRYQRKRVGVINVSDKHSGDPFTEQDLDFLSTLSSQVAVAIENARLVKEMEDGYLGALVALIQAAEEARGETRGHSLQVAELARGLGRAMGLPEARVELLVKAAALHEVGRLADQPDRRAAADHAARPKDVAEPGDGWNPAAIMAAERILAPIASLRGAREIILHSADWFDAAPIPFSADRPGPGVPVEARILSVCEEFARLTAGGDDHETTRRAIEAIRRQAGRKHDPEVVEALCRLVEARSTGNGGGR